MCRGGRLSAATSSPILERYTVFLEADGGRSSTLIMHLQVKKDFRMASRCR